MSDWYGVKDAACPPSTKGGGGEGGGLSVADGLSRSRDLSFGNGLSRLAAGAGDDEAVFGGEVSLDQQVYAPPPPSY